MKNARPFRSGHIHPLFVTPFHPLFVSAVHMLTIDLGTLGTSFGSDALGKQTKPPSSGGATATHKERRRAYERDRQRPREEADTLPSAPNTALRVPPGPAFPAAGHSAGFFADGPVGPSGPGYGPSGPDYGVVGATGPASWVGPGYGGGTQGPSTGFIPPGPSSPFVPSGPHAAFTPGGAGTGFGAPDARPGHVTAQPGYVTPMSGIGASTDASPPGAGEVQGNVGPGAADHVYASVKLLNPPNGLRRPLPAQ